MSCRLLCRQHVRQRKESVKAKKYEETHVTESQGELEQGVKLEVGLCSQMKTVYVVCGTWDRQLLVAPQEK